MARDVAPVPRTAIIDTLSGRLTPPGVDFLERQLDRIGGPGNRGVGIIGEVNVSQSQLASASARRLIRARRTEQWKVREIFLTGGGTNFSGGGGDRGLAIRTGSTIYSIIPAAALQSLSTNTARWGDTAVPYPTTAGDMNTASAKGVDIHAEYIGGTADYTAGQLTLVITFERQA